MRTRVDEWRTRKKGLEAAIGRWLDEGLSERILPFDSAAAGHCAEIASRGRRAGRPIQESDCRIAAISRSRGAVLATRNIRDFDGIGIDVVNPWTV